MNLLKTLFGIRADAAHESQARPVNLTAPEGKPTKAYSQKDDMGTRHDNSDTAEGYWMKRNADGDKSPFILYHFSSQESARRAFLELSFIKVAQDTGQIICTEVLVYGYYMRYDGKVSGVIAGQDLTIENHEAAKRAFEKHGGKLFNELKPETSNMSSSQLGETNDLSAVVFDREEWASAGPFKAKRTYYKAPNEATAVAYVKSHPVNEPMNQVGVVYPGGIICRDKDGIYRP